MEILKNFSNYFSEITGINATYSYSIVTTILTIIIFMIIMKVGKMILLGIVDNRKKNL